jgi:hypothetical protein
MTLAVADPTATQQNVPQTVPIVVLGTDALLAASPATPVQLAHACLRAGFANVVPASWGDEILAAAVLRRLPNFGNNPVIQCSCPIVAHRLLTVSGDLRPVMLALVPPPVAVARYVRTLSQPTHTRITYVGGCPGAVDDSIDIRMTPEALIAMLAERDIILEDQPRIFESVIPPDRRRFRSQPGGVPAADVLWTESGSRTLVEIDGEDFATEIAQHLLSGKSVLIDASPRLGCVCSGATASGPGKHARQKVIALEPPRATIPVVDEQAPIELDLAVPAAPRAPIDIIAVSPGLASTAANTPPRGFEASSLGHRISPVRGFAPVPDPRQSRPSNPGAPSPSRPVVGAVPIARAAEGKALPRAYIARRRPSPRATPVVRPPIAEPSSVITPEDLEDEVQPDDDGAEASDVAVESEQHILGLPFQRIPFHYVVLILLAVAVTIVASSAIAVVASRSLSRPPVSTPTTTP